MENHGEEKEEENTIKKPKTNIKTWKKHKHPLKTKKTQDKPDKPREKKYIWTFPGPKECRRLHISTDTETDSLRLIASTRQEVG